jgi:hypothetical protein
MCKTKPVRGCSCLLLNACMLLPTLHMCSSCK